jgi:D-alanyl-D-alanine carboxypeptidase (penicillin-binding protein 5/6)
MVALLAVAVISRVMLARERKASAAAPTVSVAVSSSQKSEGTTDISAEDTTVSSDDFVAATRPTQPSTTEPPTTEPPTTEPPTTIPPTTEPPPTAPPTTKPPVTEEEDSLPKLTAKNAFVYDSRTDKYLYISGDKNKAVYPASITKLFTTYVALRYLSLEKNLTIRDELDSLAADLSFAGFKKGDTLTVEAVAKGALIPSGCDASYVLAAAAGRAILQNETATTKDAIQAFMGKVNEIAAQMGMTNTNFVTPDGDHHENHKISLNSIVIIGKTCMADSFLSKVVGMSSAKITVKDAQGENRTITLKNTNENLNPQSNHYIKNCIGLKTGYTSKAGACLLGAYQVDGGYLLIGVFGCSSWDSRFPDALALLKYYT